MESNGQQATTPAMAKRLWHIVRAVFVMLREGLAKRRLLAELRLHLLFSRGKLAGKAIRGLLSDLSHNHHHHHYHPRSTSRGDYGRRCFFSCRFMDPDAAVYVPHEVQFSCSDTPFYAASRRRSHRRRRESGYDATVIARAFEILDSKAFEDSEAEISLVPSLLSTPAVPVRQLRVTDSPFAEEEKEADDTVDRHAEEFIRLFYYQRRQEMLLIGV
ncbi:hypothetical protein HPP92_008878 [Vanilla planifolia]|uniref:Avr9/Cf-9 rapidly elicited protein 146 n=1 Tax=Vanilla planifolia TaxID=51239 RepID=A0A835RI70_VANPL|nr:hypothetical protein HPP92_008878 [Vanilla planifolia]